MLSERWYPYPSRAQELTVHAAVVALALWTAVAANLQGPGVMATRSGVPKGNDFLVFYVSGTLARTGQFDALVDDGAFRKAQDPFLGANSPIKYPAVYPPQVGLAFAPLSRLRYVPAYLVWSGLTIALVLGSVHVLINCARLRREYHWPLIATALAFAPFPYLVLAGQISAVSLCALTFATVALSRRMKVTAGACIGLMAYKVSLFVPAVAICFLAGEWAIVAGAAAMAAVQTLAVVPVMGWSVVEGEVRNILWAARHAESLVMHPYLTFSWRTFWSLLLPSAASRIAYALCAAATILFAAWRWRACDDPLRRVGILSIATVIASPHLFLYDLVVLMPAFFDAVRTLASRRDRRLYVMTALAYLSPYSVVAAAFWHVQLGTILLTGWLVVLGMQPCGGLLRSGREAVEPGH
jgi:hypothetical protein